MDAFRGATVLAMMATHTTRVVPVGAGGDGLRAQASLFEPAISVAFLWLVGWSLERAYARASHSGTAWRTWYARALLRAATLYALGVLLFVLQYGVAAPYVWASPDVLGTIAWAIVVLGTLLPLGIWGLIGGTVAALALTALLEAIAAHLSGVNAGPGAALPLVGSACAGACHGLTSRRRPTSGLRWAVLGVTVGSLGWGLPGPLVDVHRALHSAADAPWFWNQTAKGMLVYGAGVALVAVAFARWSSPSKAWAPLELLGRHALVGYVGHLLVLGVGDRWLGLPSGWSIVVSVALGLGAMFTAVAMVLESPSLGRARRTASHHLGLRL
ncbi:MAG TPA: heparan-alpha-glucosaminide N-acetyltransferase domain-containing protein [Polyangiaceae bacterium]